MFGVHFGLEIDMWSLGCILAELYYGSPVFYGKDKESILQKVCLITILVNKANMVIFRNSVSLVG